MKTQAVSVEVLGVKETQSGLSKTAGELNPQGANMLGATHAAVGELAGELARAAHSAPPPQAALVAGTIKPSYDGVQLGGSTPVGKRGTPARELVYGAEHGGAVHFGAPYNAGGYWIAPTVAKERESGKTKDAIQAGVDNAIAGGGF